MSTMRSNDSIVPEVHCSDCGRIMPRGYQNISRSGEISAPLCPMCLGAALQRHIFVSGCCD